MSSKTLSQTNPYLKDPIQREKLNRISARTSSGVEGILVDYDMLDKIKLPPRDQDYISKMKAKFSSD